MEYTRQYQDRINFKNAPNTSTPLNATNLNKIDKALNYIDEKMEEAVESGLLPDILPIDRGGTGNDEGYIQTGAAENSTIGVSATVEGENNVASNRRAHAEGYNGTASGQNSHTEGNGGTASNYNAHAEGANTTASGMNSHAEGNNTVAGGDNSHAGGNYTTAGYANQTVVGKHNSNKTDTLFEVGNGTGSSAKSNALEVYSDGRVHTNKLVVGNDNQVGANTVTGIAMGMGVTAGYENQVAVGVANNNRSDTLFEVGNGSIRGQHTNAFEVYSNGNIKAQGTVSDGNGVLNAVSANPSGTASTDLTKIKIGNINYNVAGTSNYNDLSNKPQINNVALSGNKTSSDLGLASAASVEAKANKSIVAETFSSSKAYYADDVVIYNDVLYKFRSYHSGNWSGTDVDAVTVVQLTGGGSGLPENPLAVNHGGTGNIYGYIRTGALSGSTIGSYATAEGLNTTASGSVSHAEGSGTVASEDFAHAEGYQTTASGIEAHAEGNNTTASGGGSHAEGYGTVASDAYDHAEGQLTEASGGVSHAEGYKTVASNARAHAEGDWTVASGEYSHAEGSHNTAGGYCSHAGGYNNTAGYSYQTVIGRYNNNKSGTYFEVGNGTRSGGVTTPSNAFEVYNDGKISCDNGASKFQFTQSGGADGYYDASGTFHAFGSGGSGNTKLKTRYSVSYSSWSSTVNSDGYYTLSLTMSPTLDTSVSPDVLIAGSSNTSQPTDTHKTMFSYVERCYLSGSSLTLYAKTKPTSTFYIWVEGVAGSGSGGIVGNVIQPNGAVSGGITYITGEQDTGDVWIDGRKIYRQRFTFNMPTITGTSWVTGSLNALTNIVNELIGVEQAYTEQQGQNCVIPRYTLENNELVPMIFLNVFQWNDAVMLRCYSNSIAYSEEPVYVWIKYTKK